MNDARRTAGAVSETGRAAEAATEAHRAAEAATEAHRAAEAALRRSYGKLIAFLSARTRDVAGAEDALSEAFAAALAEWPSGGIPNNPDAWLLTVARRRMIDASRRRQTGEDASADLLLMAGIAQDEHGEDPVVDDRLPLMFACAHPALDPGVRAPLILQTVLGFDAASIASAFLVAPSTMGQRLVRAKAMIRQAGIPFRVPDEDELPARLAQVLEAIYAIFTEGWSDPAGTEVRRRNLADEGIWLARLVASLLPAEPEAIGLLALMLYAEARRDARRTDDGRYVPLAEQDPALWNASLISEAEALLFRASTLGKLGRYQLEAAVQSAHVIRRRTGRADWAAIVELYDALLSMTGSPVVAINRAIALAQTRGASEGLASLRRIGGDKRLAQYQPYWAALASLLARHGDIEEADRAYEQAIGLEADPAVRAFLLQRREELRQDANQRPESPTSA